MELPFKTDLEQELTIAIEAALNAGKKVMEIFPTDFVVKEKSLDDPVTSADLASNDLILSYLEKSPYPILSEEKLDDPLRLNSKRVWIVDPLDGTKSFVNRNEEFCILIGLVENHIPILGVIVQPINNKLFIAVRNKGAYVYESNQWKKLTVTTNAPLETSRAILSKNHFSEKEKNFLSYLNMENVLHRGSALKITTLSEGNAEIYFTFSDQLKQWDTCASNCILTEAGGVMTDLDGEKLNYNTKNLLHDKGILATTSQFHILILQKIKNYKNGNTN
jgi:3'(2'), 5'-bisphosphate nucleotidase